MEHIASLAKISPPRLSTKVYPRSRLFGVLDDALSKSIIWIAAPAGSGKTTLIASYIKKRKLPCLWCQLDEGDGDLASFFYYMGLATHKVARRKRPMPLLMPEYMAGLPTFSKNFFRELFTRFKAPGVVVLDNYQDVPAESMLHDILMSGLEEIPQDRTVIIISRHEPPKAYARQRVSGDLIVLGWEAVRLTLEEGEGLSQLRHGKKALPSDALKQWYEKTQGWVAGLVLWLEQGTGTAMPTGTFDHDTQRVLFDYFSGELFEQSDAMTQDFLLKTAYLPEIVISAAERLTGHANAKQVLEDLTRKNFFTLQHQRSFPSYAYHPLFREFLIERSEAVWGAQERASIQHSAARQLVRVGQMEEAAALYRATQDWQGLETIILQQAPSLAAQGRFVTLGGWLSGLPKAVIHDSPWLLYWRGVSQLTMNPSGAQQDFEKAFHLFKSQNDPAGCFLSWSGVLDSIFMMLANLTDSDPWIDELTQLMKTYPRFPTPEIEAKVTHSMLQALAFRSPRHPRVNDWVERSMRLLQHAPDPTNRLQAGGSLAWYFYLYDDPSKADVILQNIQAMKLRPPKVSPLTFIQVKTVEAHHLVSAAKPDLSFAALSEALEVAHSSGIRVLNFFLLGHSAGAALTAANLSKARDFLNQMAPALDRGTPTEKAHYHALAAWEALMLEDFSVALQHAQTAVELSELIGSPPIQLINWFSLVQALHEVGEQQQARDLLSQALELSRKLNSPVFEYRYLFAEAQLALDRHDEKAGINALRQAMAIGKEKGLVNFEGWRPKVMTRLCMIALEAGIEVDYVQGLIRKRNLIPETPPFHLESWPWPVKILTLGQFSLSKEGKPIQSTRKAQKKPLELLKAIIAFGGQEVKEETLTDVLWPDADGDAAHWSFETTIKRLRTLLGDKETLLLKEGRMSLNPTRCWVDTWAFERLLKAAETNGDEKGYKKMAEQALALYKGDFLGNDADDLLWTVLMRERLRSRYLQVIRQVAGLCEAQEDWETAVHWYLQALDVDPLMEEFYQQLILGYTRLGQQVEAKSTYHQCREMLKCHLGTAPSPRTEAIYQQTLNA